MSTPRIFKGTRDFLPEEMIGREQLIDTIKTSFRAYGFLPMETPSLEFMDILRGQYGDDEKLLYKLAYKGGNELALRYDLTVPLSRVMAMHPHLTKPFKRYQIQPVWRGDRPQPKQGRFREFYQCDIDTVGTKSLLADAEIIALTYDILIKLGFSKFKIRINHRRILAGFFASAGFPASEEANVCRSLDKLLKIGWDGVKKELAEKNYEKRVIDKLYNLEWGSLGTNFTELDEPVFDSNDALRTGKAELLEIRDRCVDLGVDEAYLDLNLTLSRGLNYYTGCIYESYLPDTPHIGSLTGGGRYDNLIGTFSGTDIPAVGATIGLDRIYTAMQQLDMLQSRTTTTQVFVMVYEEATRSENLKLVTELRAQGFNVEVPLDSVRREKQFSYAGKKCIPIIVVQGPDEIKDGNVLVKYKPSSGTSVEVKCARSEVAVKIREVLDRIELGE